MAILLTVVQDGILVAPTITIGIVVLNRKYSNLKKPVMLYRKCGYDHYATKSQIWLTSKPSCLLRNMTTVQTAMINRIYGCHLNYYDKSNMITIKTVMLNRKYDYHQNL